MNAKAMSSAIFLILENWQIGNHPAIQASIRDIAGKGFGAILLQLRDTAFQLDDAQVIRTVRCATDEAHRFGLKLYLTFITTTCRPWFHSFFKKYPAAGEIRAYPARGRIKNGFLQAVLRIPPFGAEPFVDTFADVITAFARKGGSFHRLPRFRWSLQTERRAGTNKNGEWEVSPHLELTIGGRARGWESGEAVIYAGVRNLNPDYASPLFDKFMSHLLGLYRGIPLDGVAWDEPGPPGSFDYYKCSHDFQKVFRQLCGYELLNHLYLLDSDQPGSARVRHDYFRTLRDCLFARQKYFVDQARRLFGQGIFSGVHHTWCGEGTSLDLTCGCIDYFHLSKNLTGGFSDGGFSDEKSLVYTMLLARSLGKFHPSREATSNCGDFCPTVEKLLCFTGLLAIWKIRWLTHSYGHGMIGHGPGYPHHPTWEVLPRMTKRIREFHRFISDGYEENRRVMIYHSWESLAHINTPFVHLHKTALINLANALFNENIPFDFVGEDQLRNVELVGDKLCPQGYVYDVLVIPWANMLPRHVYQWLREAGRTKVKTQVIVFGPPPDVLTDGASVRSDFEKQAAAKLLPLRSYIAECEKVEGEIVTRKPSATFAPAIQGKLPFITQGNLTYHSGVSPDGDLLKLIKRALGECPIKTEASDVIYSVYEKDDDFIFVATGKHGLPFHGRFIVKDWTIQVGQAQLLGVKMKSGRPSVVGEKLKAVTVF